MNILFIPHDTWSNPQRSKFICRHLSKDYETHVLDFTKFENPKDYFSSKLIETWYYKKRTEDGITVHKIPRLSPALFSSNLRKINYRISDRYIARIIKENSIEVTVSTSIVKPPKAPKLIFDIFDDRPAYWREFRRNEIIAREIEKVEQEFVEVSDEVVTCSHVLRDKIPRESTLISNGVDIDRIRGGNKSEIIDELDIPGKIVGFIGNHGRFSGLTKVVEAANILKKHDVHFLIAGAGSEVPKAKKMVKEYDLKNIIFLGHIERVSGFFASIDIGLIPFQKYSFTDNASPIKLFEYTAAKVPVVSTNLEEIKRLNFSNVILVNDNATDLVDGIKKALEWKPKFPDIEKYEWKNLAKKYAKLIES
jgi:glycosyltransferase involved in cell wall biosynthesis